MIDTVRFTRTLDFYDWILQFEARDAEGYTWFGEVRDWKSGTYTLARCMPGKLDDVRAGRIPVRHIFQDASFHLVCHDVYPPWEDTPVDMVCGPVPEEHLPSLEWVILPEDYEWEIFPFNTA